MAQEYGALRRDGIEVMAIAPDRADRLARYWEEHQLPFRVASDPDGQTLRALGQQVNWARMGRMPALLAVAADGTVLDAHYGSSMRDVGDVAAARALVRSAEKG
jgi:peroxiredoxin